MNKKYKIINDFDFKYYITNCLNNYIDNDNFFVNIFYFILILIVISLIYSFIYKNNSYEKFTSQNISQDITHKTHNLSHLVNILNEYDNNMFISQNFDKIKSGKDDNIDELEFVISKFDKRDLPYIPTENKLLINTENELTNIIDKVKNMKNIYKVGDIVNKNSDFNITATDICYKNNKSDISQEILIKEYPNCMVCSVTDKKNLHNSPSWHNTHTNINSVCLYNPSSTNSNIPNLSKCQEFCNIKK